MSRRSSAGDLVPRDITEILAREGRAQRGQKKSGGSLGQAFSWLKGSRKKKNISNGQNRTGIGSGATEGGGTKLGHQNHDPAKVGPKGQDDQKRLTVHYTASQHYQENVFIEGSRPQYLEDLHTEAQEGLKILQQEEHNSGVDVQDDQRIDSTAVLQQEQDTGSKEGDGSPESGNTAGINVTTPASAVSAVSTRPVLTRQGSTFKPLNPVKRLDKGRKRTRRTTIMGIPQQVQRELALHRGSMYQQGESNQIANGKRQVSDSQSGVVIIPTIDGETPITNHEGARVHLPGLEASREELLLHHHLQSVYRDDLGYTHHLLGSRLSPTPIRRPKSLAVPGMTSSVGLSYLQEPQGPVMSISPQATYLSKIIPNAILPASVDVIQIDRRNSRSHGNQGGRVRTVSKSSLASVESSASPASSRRSGGDGCYADDSQDDPTATPSGSNWSQSQSSETIMSNSSTISSSKGSSGIGNPQTVSLAGQERRSRQPRDKDVVSHQSSASGVSSISSKGGSPPTGQGSESGLSGSVSAGEMSEARGESIRNSRVFSRSLSVMKTKLPPAPPRRTYSLHQEKMMRRRSKELLDVKDPINGVAGEVEAGGDGSLAADETGLITKDPVPISATSIPLSPTKAPLDGGPPEHQTGSSNSSPQKAPSEGGLFERTMSPSSGYSSQSGTPTLSPKGICPTSSSPAKQKKKPVKPERSGSRASSSAASVSSSLTSLSSSTSEPVNKEALANSPSPPQQSTPSAVAATPKTAVAMAPSPDRLAIREEFNIPPPPKVKAPPPPPPETWAHNSHTFELLCGPSPKLNRLAQLQQQQQQKEAATVQKKEPLVEAEGSAEKQATAEEVVLSESKERDKTEPMLEKVPECVSQEPESMESLTKEPASPVVTEREETSVEVQRQEQSDIVQVKKDESQESVAHLPKKEPPPIMKKSTPTPDRKEFEKADVCQHQVKTDGITTEDTVNLPTEKDNALSQTEVVLVLADKIDGQVATEKTSEESNTKPLSSMQALPENPPKVDRSSPSASPPPAHQPPPPPTKKTPPSSVSTLPPEEEEGGEEEGHIVESCWPPPPPPLVDPAESVFDGPDEMDFPPPPPPFIADSLPDVVESCTIVTDVQDISTVALEETGVAMNGEGEDLLEEAKPEEVTLEINPKPAEAISKVLEPAVTQTTSEDTTAVTSVQTDEKQTGVAQELITVHEATTPSILISQLGEVPPQPEEIPPPPLVAPPPPPMTSSEMPPASAPLSLPISAPLPPPLPLEDQAPSGPPVSAPFSPPDVPLPPPLPTENQATVNFRRHPSLVNRETRSKELLARNKSAPISKEDANIPLVTPSLLQMVRLRSVNVGEDQVKAPSEENIPSNDSTPIQDDSLTSSPGPQSVPQKPIRKSLSLKSLPATVKSPSVTLNAPSMRLQEAIRMKTAAMSSRDGFPTRLNVRSSTSSSNSSVGEPGVQSLMSPEGGDLHKYPASTASFIFSRSTKKVVIETPTSPEAQANLKQSLAAELMQMSDQSKAAVVINGNTRVPLRKPGKIPPPVAKKPTHGSTHPSDKPAYSGATGAVEMAREPNGGTETVQPAGQQAPLDDQDITSETETSNMVETPLPV